MKEAVGAMATFRGHVLWRYGVAVAATGIVTGLTLLLQPFLRNGVMALFFGSVMVSAWYGGIGPGLLASFLSVLASQYFFFPPIYSLKVSSGDDVAQIVVFSSVTVLISSLTNSQKRAVRALLESKERLQEYADAVWEQQRRIASELHDSLGQELTGLGFLSKSLSQSLQGAPGAESAQQIKAGVERALEQIRGMAKGVMPVEREPDGLMSALQQLAASVGAIHRVECRFDCPAPVLFDDHQKASQLYRIAQEAVTNALKHARAKTVAVRLERKADGVHLEVRDDGTGISQEAERSAGSGLKIMRYRVASLGGTLRISRNPPGGTLVACFVPAEPGRPLETGPLA
jgi:signal transduction histidine kinase